MSKEEERDLTAVAIRRERLAGLKLRASKIRPKVTVSAFLDDLLEKADIPCIPEQELEKEEVATT